MARFHGGGSTARRDVLPGFGLTMGFTITYLSALVLVPLLGLAITSSGLTWHQFVDAAWTPRIRHAYLISFGCALIAAFLNAVMGLVVAWVLVRYRFPGRRLVDAMVDLPFALPTAVAGLALVTLYDQHGWIGQWLKPLGIRVAYDWKGVVVALTFIGLPFVVRTVQPVLEDLGAEVEDAAGSLGANRWQVFARIILPELWPPLLTGFALAFARAVGEYGSVIFISGNIIKSTEIAPAIIMEKTIQENGIPEAAAIAVVMLAASFVLLFVINLLQRWSAKRMEP
jgi:sulfate transport system permease protein